MKIETVLNAIIAGGALMAWRTAVRTYRGSYRPVLRPVPKRHQSGAIASTDLVLKNIGRGPAVSVSVVEPDPPPHLSMLVVTIDVVEPLGAPRTPDGDEASRIGRVDVRIPAKQLLRRDVTYRLLYQDLTARWHETTFSYDDEHVWRAKHLGPRWWWQIPREVRRTAQIVNAAE